MKKSFILDTNVLLHDPQALFRFEDNDLVIPMTVIEEIDRFKKELSETGRNARQFSRIMDGLRAKAKLIEGVELETGGHLRVDLYTEEHMKGLPPELRTDRGDNRILAVALDVKSRSEKMVILVTKDTNLRIKADAIGLTAEDYESDKVSLEDLYSGTGQVFLPRDDIDRFYSQGFLPMKEEFLPNQCLTLMDAANPSHTALARYNRALRQAVPLLRAPKEGLWGVHSAQSRAAVRLRPPAQRRHPAGDPGRQGRHRQDPAGDCRRAAQIG